jgi:pimeloyl-ACP methyl ester carboxylesterase
MSLESLRGPREGSRPRASGQRVQSPPPDPLYLEVDGLGDPIFGFLHTPADRSPAATAVLICPPFGWDDICSYRSRRAWAEQLALDGHPTLRIDLPGAGDSAGSPSDPARLSAWTVAVGAAATELRSLSGCERLAAIGIGLGGLAICAAVAVGAPIEEAVLWATPSRGRTLLRELRAFARLEDAPFEESDMEQGSPILPEGATIAGGFLIARATVQALEQLDLATLPLENGRLDRVLLLERDGLPVDARLGECLAQSGATVAIAPGDGYGAMMTKPHLAQAPTDVFARTRSWLRERSSAGAHSDEERTMATSPGIKRLDSIELAVADARVRETPLRIAQPFGVLFGVLAEPTAEPASGLCAVMLNAGAIRRIGPSRMWVETARRWAAMGVPTLRLDLEGIGDADGDADRFTELSELYVPRLVDQVIAALDVLQARGTGERFVLSGLCSGAYWSFQAALRDERVAAAFLLNPKALFWDPLLETARDFRRGVLRVSSWRSVLHGEVPPARFVALARQAPLALPRRAAARRSARRSGEDQLERAFDRLRDADKRIQLIFSGNEPLHEELELDGWLSQLGRWPNVALEIVPGRDHTLRPLPSQHHTRETLDRALVRELQTVN